MTTDYNMQDITRLRTQNKYILIVFSKFVRCRPSDVGQTNL